MCGIFGYVSRSGEQALDLGGLYSDIRHRGPDAAYASVLDPVSGVLQRHPMEGVVSAQILLAHVRLSIIDTTNAGIQPFESEDGRYVLAYNGEVYNHIELRHELEQCGWSFTTRTDTEVVLKSWIQWGVSCLGRFVGMFAFLLLDRRDQRLIAVRDPFGIKPLYFCDRPESLIFCSDYMALARFVSGAKSAIRTRNAAFYLRYGVTQIGSETLIEGIDRVDLGEVVEINLTTKTISKRMRYFDIESIAKEDWSFDEAKQALRDQFLENVALHMRSDVPYAATLSGGIDSSAIVCAMRTVSDAPIHTFSFHANTASISETRWIDIVNRHVGAVEHPIRLSQQDFEVDLDRLVRYQGEPFGSLSIFASFKVQEAVAAAGYKVVLSGQGADELLAGYNHYLGDYCVGLLRSKKYSSALAFLSNVGTRGQGMSAKQLFGLVAERLLGEGAVDMLRRLGQRPHFPPWVRIEHLRDQVPSLANIKKHKCFRGSRLRGALRHSLFGWGLADLLRYEDRNAMAHSIENRVPFLTPSMVQLTLSMPDSFLISQNGSTKHILREAMRGIVPDEILNRRDKIGFAPDNSIWLDKKYAAQLVHRHWTSQVDPFIDRDALLMGISQSDLSNRRQADSIWRSINLIVFAHKFRTGIA